MQSNDVSGIDLQQAVLMIFVNFGVLCISLLLLYLGTIGVGPWISMVMYFGIFLYERSKGIFSPVSLIMMIANLTGGILFFILDDISYLMLSAPAIYFLLAVVCLAYQLKRRPFTSLYTRGAGFQSLYRTNSLVWIIIFFSSGFASVVFIPLTATIYLPSALVLAGIFFTIVTHFVYFGNANERSLEFQLENFSFVEVTTAKQFEDYYKVVGLSFWFEFRRSVGSNFKLNCDDIIRIQQSEDQKYQGNIVRFVGYAGDEPAGAISVFFEGAEQCIPMKGIHPDVDFDKYRSGGRIAEVCRLSIVSKYRMNSVLLKGLFRCLIDLASERGLAYIFTDAFKFRVSTYQKVGFKIIGAQKETDIGSLDFGIPVQPLVLDYRKTILLEQITPTAREMFRVINQYVSERYFNRLVIKKYILDPCANHFRGSGQ